MVYNLRKRKTPSEPVEKKKTKKEKDVVTEPTIVKRQKKEKNKVEPCALSNTTDAKLKLSNGVSTSPELELAKETPVIKDVPVAKKPKIEQDQTCNLFMFGQDSCGEFGLKKIGFTRRKPTQVPLDSRVRHVACGPMHTIALTTAGKIYSFGCNDEGALGRVTNDEEEEATPTLVNLDNNFIKVTAGDSHSVALTDDGRVFIWGNFKDNRGSIGLLPQCNGEKTYTPMEVVLDGIKFKDIASGANHVLLLDSKGDVFSFGDGAQGQLGRLKSEELGPSELESFPITADNRDLFLKPQQVNLKNVDPQRPFICDAIYAGNYSSFATNTDKKKNRLAGWGLNNYHQLGYKGGVKGSAVQHFPKRSTFTCSTSMASVACGQHHTLFMTRSGRLLAAGKPLYGMLGIGKVSSETVCPAKKIDQMDGQVVCMAAGTSTSFAVTKDGKLYSWGMNSPSLGVDGDDDLEVPTEVKILEGKNVTHVVCGNEFTSVLVE